LEGVYIVVAGRKEAPAEKAHMQYGVWPLDDTNSTLNRIGPNQQQPGDWISQPGNKITISMT
jgi:hypothetical protein